MLKFLKYILQLLISPKNGWEDIQSADFEPKELLSAGLYPFIGIAACTCFVPIFVRTEATVASCLQEGIVTFISYFATFFVANIAFSLLYPKYVSNGLATGETEAYSERESQIFIAFTVGVMVLISILKNLIVVELSLLQFLPLYVAFIIWKGTEYFHIESSRTGQFMFLSIFSIVLPPLLIQSIFRLILQ